MYPEKLISFTKPDFHRWNLVNDNRGCFNNISIYVCCLYFNNFFERIAVVFSATDGCQDDVASIGGLATYGHDGQKFDFYEIDPAVKDIAYVTSLFTYLTDSPPEVNVILGDARLSIANKPNDYYETSFDKKK